MSFKENTEDAKQRLAAWWDRESTDRPVIAYTHPRPEALRMDYKNSWYLAEHWDAIDEYCDLYEHHCACMYFGGEAYPNLFINYGAGIMASIFGCEPRFIQETVWFDCPTPIDQIVDKLETVQLNENNPWYARLLRVTEAAAEHSQGRYSISFTDIGGILDILSSFLGPKDIIVNMRRNPQIIDTCREIILEKVTQLYDDLAAIVARYNLGYNGWMDIWCPKRWYPLQCDFSAMLSPTLFRRFVLPDLQTQAAHMDYAIYHLDGPNELPYLDDLLAVPEITGIQWVPGVQGPVTSDDKWLPVYQKIQAAGKNIVMDPPGEGLAKVYQQLNPQGIYASTHFNSQIIAEFFLPKWMGGFEGIEPED